MADLPLYNRIFSVISSPMLICNREGGIENANQASGKAFGLQERGHNDGEISLSAMLSQSSADVAQLLIQRVLDGRKIPFAFMVHVDRSNGFAGLTERYSAKISKFDEELVLMELQPVDDIGLIDRLWQAKMRTMLHDLKSPANNVVGFSDSLLTRTDMKNDPQAVELLGYVKQAGQKIIDQVNNQLAADLTHVSLIATPHIEWFDLSFFVREAATNLCNGCSVTINDAPLESQSQLPKLMVLQDASLLALMLNNLLSNAMKYTADGKINIDYGASNGRIVLTVRDYGHGVPRNEEHLLFDPESKLSNRKNGSTHLGLPLTKMLADALCGDVHYASTVPGSSFSIILPNFGKEQP